MRRSVLTILAASLLALPAAAKLPYVKKAKDLGLTEVKNCQYCHMDKMPKKDSKGEPFAEPGKYLLKKKAETKAAEVDVAWLKDYTAKK